MQQIKNGESPDEVTMRADAMILGLRLMEGVSAPEFRDRFGISIEDAYGPAVRRHVGYGLLEWVGDRLRLTTRGQLLSNSVFVDILPDYELADTEA